MVFVGGWWSSLVVVAVERLELLESVSRSRERLATLRVRDRHHMASGSVSRDTIVSRYNRVTTSVVHVYQASRVISNGVDKHRCHHDLVVVGFIHTRSPTFNSLAPTLDRKLEGVRSVS